MAGRPRLEVAGHLAACPACAERSRRAAHLDRIWEATRPGRAGRRGAIDALWARASIALDAHQAVAGHGSKIRIRRALPPPTGRWAKSAAFALAAQAAAILAAALFLLRREGPGAGPPSRRSPP